MSACDVARALTKRRLSEASGITETPGGSHTTNSSRVPSDTTYPPVSSVSESPEDEISWVTLSAIGINFAFPPGKPMHKHRQSYLESIQ